MRISDWSSDVCSSDLLRLWEPLACCRRSLWPNQIPVRQRLRLPEHSHRHSALRTLSSPSSEERRVRKEGVSPRRSRWSPQHSNKTATTNHKISTAIRSTATITTLCTLY